MHAFLPELIFAILFMRRFGKAPPLEQELRFLLLQMIDDPAGGIGFEAGHVFVQLRGLGDEVRMIFQDHVAVKFQTDALALILPTVQDDWPGSGRVKTASHSTTVQVMTCALLASVMT